MQHPTMGLFWRGDPQNPLEEHEGHFSGIVETFVGEFCRSRSVDEVGTRTAGRRLEWPRIAARIEVLKCPEEGSERRRSARMKRECLKSGMGPPVQ
jgi:hypothetical protein